FYAWATHMRAFAHDVGIFGTTGSISRISPSRSRDHQTQFHIITKPASSRAIPPVAGSLRDNDDFGCLRSIVSLVIQSESREQTNTRSATVRRQRLWRRHVRSQPLSVLLLCPQAAYNGALHTTSFFGLSIELSDPDTGQ